MGARKRQVRNIRKAIKYKTLIFSVAHGMFRATKVYFPWLQELRHVPMFFDCNSVYVFAAILTQATP